MALSLNVPFHRMFSDSEAREFWPARLIVEVGTVNKRKAMMTWCVLNVRSTSKENEFLQCNADAIQ